MSSDDWECFKATILHLYTIENLPLNKVARYMQHEHGFAKTKSQYEYQFKKWHIKKYAKNKDWKHLRHQLERRAGKECEVTMFGIPLSPGRVRKETQRYAYIPTASEFGRTLTSPESRSGVIIRAQTPTIVENITWPSLLWFRFKNTVLLPTLQEPSALLRNFFAARSSRQFVFHFIPELVNTIPNDNIHEQEATGTLTQKDSSFLVAKEVLKVIFFCLSNRIVPFIPLSFGGLVHQEAVQAHDYFVLQLVEAVSHTNPEMISSILHGRCITTKVIREAIYGSAIREKHYMIVSYLLESGVDPDLPIIAPRKKLQSKPSFRGVLKLSWEWPPHVLSTAMENAAYTCDARLGKMLLHAGASLRKNFSSILEIASYANNTAGNSKSAMEFVQLLVEHGVSKGYLTSWSPNQGPMLISPIAIAISRSDICMAEFLMGKCWNISRLHPSEKPRCGWSITHNEDPMLMDLRGMEKEPLHIAVVLGNERLIGQLLFPILSHPPQVSMRTIKEAFLISGLAGDVDTGSKLIASHPNAVLDNVGTGITALAAAAWNKEDTTLAEELLRLGAEIESVRSHSLTVTPSPLHIAAFYGNIGLVRQLLARGADCNVRYKSSLSNLSGKETPIQLALEGGNVEMAKLLIPHSALLGPELIQAVSLRDDGLIWDIICKGANYEWAKPLGRSVLDVAVETGNTTVISSCFRNGGKYESLALFSAVREAITSKDHSIVKLLTCYRLTGEIDGNEASSLTLCIEKREWDLVFLLLQDPFIPSSAKLMLRLDDRRSRTPLLSALASGNQSVIEALIKRGYVLHSADIWQMQDADQHIRQALWSRFPLESMNLSCHRTLLLSTIKLKEMGKVRRYIKLVGCLNFDCRFPGDLPRPGDEEDVWFFNFAYCPLFAAMLNDDIELTQFLLNAGADVDFIPKPLPPEEERITPLQFAARRRYLGVVRLLLDRGARVNLVADRNEGATALQWSAIHGDLNAAQLLVSRGADINAPPAKNFGHTALEGAAAHGRLDMVQYLLEMGAQIDRQLRIHYVRAVAFARREGQFAIADYLMEYGSWGDRDQRLYENPINLYPNVYFRYDEELDNWHIRELARINKSLCNINLGLSDNGSSSGTSDGSDDSVDYSYESNSNEHYIDERDGEEPPIIFDNTAGISQFWWDGMDPAMVDSGFDTTGEETRATQAVTELNDGAEAIDLVQFNSQLREGVSDLGVNNCAPGIYGMEAAAEEPLFGISEEETACHANDQFESAEQRTIVEERESGLEVHNNAPGIGPSDEQSTTLNVMEDKWVGPFTGFNGFDGFDGFSGFDDVDDTFGIFPFHS
ncbi:ankyrin repeat-containing domain protein [Xylaria sp. FL0064]|nr:ankyrin repeat-containing domain protein [Xylaria sp. FL0064]